MKRLITILAVGFLLLLGSKIGAQMATPPDSSSVAGWQFTTFTDVDDSLDLKMNNTGDTTTGTYNFSGNPLEFIRMIDFDDTITAPAHSEGRVFYDKIDNTLSVYNNEADISLNVGQESWVYARNITGSTILDGKVVYITGAVSSRPTIALAQADAEATCKLLGVATHDIETATNGYVTICGVVHGIDLSDFSDGDEVFLSATVAGSLTTVAPSAPNCAIEIGYVIDGSVNGDLFVLLGKNKSLNMLQDVLISGPAAGNVLVYDGTVWADSESVPLADSTTAEFLHKEGGIMAGPITTPDDVSLIFGSSNDWSLTYDEATDDQLLLVGAITTSGALLDPLFEILVPASPAANQQVFGVAKGTQASNTWLFTVDEDGDVGIAGILNMSDKDIINIGILNADVLRADGSALAVGNNTETIEIKSSDWDISTTGTITNAEWQGTAVADAYVADNITVDEASDVDTTGTKIAAAIANAHTSLVKAFVIQTIDSDHDIKLWKTPVAITIDSVFGQCDGGTNVIGALDEYDWDNTDLVAIVNSDWTFTTTYQAVGSFSNAGIAAKNHLKWHTTSVSGTVNFFDLTIWYHED